jgi:two-component system phosphate regulon sensor histidine kinase PhoR
MRLRLSFQGWVLGGCFLVVLSTLVFVAVILQNSLQSQLMDQTRETLSRELGLVEELVADHWSPASPLAESDGLADRLGQGLSLRVTLIAADGTVLGDSHLSPGEVARVENHADRPEVRQALAQGKGSQARHSTTLGRTMLYAAEKIQPPGRPPVVVRVAVPLAQVEKTLGHTRSLVVGALLLGLLLSTGVAYLVARRISRPLKELTRTATGIARGDLSRRLWRYPANEVGELGRAFDRMADSLQGQIQAVTQARDRLEAVLRSMVEGVLVTHRDGRIILANRAVREMLGLSLDPVGSQTSDVIRNPDLLAALAQARGGQALATREIRSLGPPKRFLEASVSRLSDEGLGSGCVAVLHDITELKRTDQVRRDFVANVSHELRTPLAAIRGSVETLLEGGALDSPDDARRFAEAISRQVIRLQRLVQDLLELAAIEGGEVAAPKEQVRLAELAEGLLGMVEDLARSRGVEIVSTVDERAMARADRRGLEQAVLNLLDNAIKYTEPGGRVTLDARLRDREAVVSVSDTGPGIAAEHLPRIFERFYRVDKNRSREMGGTGLGLAIVKHVAQSQGGRVEVESTPGRGSTFRLVLPA